jgi:plasmid stability protein
VKKNLRIAGIDAEILAALKARAERNNRSVEDEVLEILRTEYADQPTPQMKTDN